VPDKRLTSEDEAALWQLARRLLALKKLKPSVSSDLADRLRTQLPARQKGETLGDLIRRASARDQPTAQIKPFRTKPVKRFKPLAEFVRLAADTHDAEMPLPEPDSALESADGRFRLQVTATGDHIDISIQVLGFAADELAHSQIGLADPRDVNEVVAIMTLDEDGDGQCKIEDSSRLRRALLKPVIVLLNE
jgi:hypothetical protein